MGRSTQGLKIVEEVVKEVVPSNPYGNYATPTKTTRTKQAPNTPIEQYRAYVQKHMEIGAKQYGVKVENQHINKCNDKTNIMRTQLFSGYCFIKDITHEVRGKVYEFIIPSLYMKGCGDNTIKRVCDEETQRIIETDSQVGLLPEQDEIVS